MTGATESSKGGVQLQLQHRERLRFQAILRVFATMQTIETSGCGVPATLTQGKEPIATAAGGPLLASTRKAVRTPTFVERRKKRPIDDTRFLRHLGRNWPDSGLRCVEHQRHLPRCFLPV